MGSEPVGCEPTPLPLLPRMVQFVFWGTMLPLSAPPAPTPSLFRSSPSPRSLHLQSSEPLTNGRDSALGTALPSIKCSRELAAVVLLLAEAGAPGWTSWGTHRQNDRLLGDGWETWGHLICFPPWRETLSVSFAGGHSAAARMDALSVLRFMSRNSL